MNMNNNFVNVRDVETDGLYSANFGRAVYPFERHHIIPYMTCMGNNDVELACDAMNNSVDLPRSIHIKLHKYLADNGYPKHVAFSESEYGNIRELTYEFLVEYTDLLDDYYNPNIPMDVVIRKYNSSIGDGKSDAWNHVDDIVAKYESGINTHQLGNEYGVCKDTISTILTSNGVELRNSGSPMSDAWNFADDIVAKYESGMTTNQLGNEYGVNDKTIGRILRTNGVELRNGRRPKSDAWDHVDDIVRDYESEMSQRALGRKYGVSHTIIRRILVSAGAI